MLQVYDGPPPKRTKDELAEFKAWEENELAEWKKKELAELDKWEKEELAEWFEQRAEQNRKVPKFMGHDSEFWVTVESVAAGRAKVNHQALPIADNVRDALLTTPSGGIFGQVCLSCRRYPQYYWSFRCLQPTVSFCPKCCVMRKSCLKFCINCSWMKFTCQEKVLEDLQRESAAAKRDKFFCDDSD